MNLHVIFTLHSWLHIWGRDYNRIRTECSTKWGMGVKHASTSWACNGQSLISNVGVPHRPLIWSASWWVFIIGSVPDLSLKETALRSFSMQAWFFCKAPLPTIVATSWWQMVAHIHHSNWWAYINAVEKCRLCWNDGWHAWIHRTCHTVNWYFLIFSILILITTAMYDF